MKKILKIVSILLIVIISISVFFYARYLNLDTYTWDTDNDILTLGEKQYKVEPFNSLEDLKLEKQIGKIEGEDYYLGYGLSKEKTLMSVSPLVVLCFQQIRIAGLNKVLYSHKNYIVF